MPVRRAGSAGGVLQTARRIGSAAGIAVTGSVFYAHVGADDGASATAFRHAVVVIVCFVTAAPALAIADAVTRTSDEQRAKHA